MMMMMTMMMTIDDEDDYDDDDDNDVWQCVRFPTRAIESTDHRGSVVRAIRHAGKRFGNPWALWAVRAYT